MSTPTRTLRLLVLGAVALAVLAGAAVATADTQRLVVADADTGETLLSAPVENGTTVGIEYTHSVEKTRVYDGYTVRGDRLEMTRMEFESYGWGLPAGADVQRENGTLVYDPPGVYKELYVKTGYVADHRLLVGDNSYNLTARADGGSVRLHLDRRTGLPALRTLAT